MERKTRPRNESAHDAARFFFEWWKQCVLVLSGLFPLLFGPSNLPMCSHSQTGEGEHWRLSFLIVAVSQLHVDWLREKLESNSL